MQFTSSILATVLAIGFVQAQTPTCSNVPNPSPPVTMHCNVRGVLDPALINITSSNVVASVDACITLSKAYEDSLAFSYNYTSLVCTQYATNLHLMGLKQKKKLDFDTVYFNHNCYVQQCNNGIVSTSTAADGSATTVTSAAPMTTTAPTCDKNADRCLSMFNKHPKTASSMCSGVQTQYFPPQGFGGACTQVWDTQVSSVCSCLFGAQLVPTTTFMANTTVAPTSVPANTTASATGTGGSSTITDAPVFSNTSTPAYPSWTGVWSYNISSTMNTTSTDAPFPTLLPPTFNSTTTSDTFTVGPIMTNTSSTDMPTVVPVLTPTQNTTLVTMTTSVAPIITDPSVSGFPNPTGNSTGMNPTQITGTGASGTGAAGPSDTAGAPFAVGANKRSFRLRRNQN